MQSVPPAAAAATALYKQPHYFAPVYNTLRTPSLYNSAHLTSRGNTWAHHLLTQQQPMQQQPLLLPAMLLLLGLPACFLARMIYL
jgi:hypothetical protein